MTEALHVYIYSYVFCAKIFLVYVWERSKSCAWQALVILIVTLI